MRLGSNYYLTLVLVVLSAQFNFSEGQRASIVERLKALDKGIRQGLQRQKSDLPISTSASSQVNLPVRNTIQNQDERFETATYPQQLELAVNTLEPGSKLGSKPTEQISQKTDHQQLSVLPEDADGTSDVVRQLTESFEEEDDEVIS